MDTHPSNERSARLEALFNHDSDPLQRRSCLIENVLEPDERAPICQEIIDNENMIVRPKIIF